MEARRTRGLKPQDVANDAGIPVERLMGLEAGRGGATTSDVSRIAEVLELDAAALLAGRRLERPSFTAYLRHTGTMQDFAASDVAVLEGGLAQARALVDLRALLGEAPGLFASGTFKPRAAPNRNAARAGYLLAREVRRALQNPTEPLGDLRELLELTFGIAVVRVQLATPRATALGLKAGRAGAVIVAESTPNRAARGYLAHELGHVLFDPAARGVQVAIDVENGHRSVMAAEQRARGFSAELLLPEAGVAKVLGAPSEVSGQVEAVRLVARARDYFGASWPMTANHLCNLRFIQADLRPWLEVIDGPEVEARYVERQRTSLPTHGTSSLAVQTYVQRAYERSLVTDAEARSMLGLDFGQRLPWDED